MNLKTTELVHLSVRQAQVLKSVADGKTQKQIAKDLHVSEHTIRTYFCALRLKFGANNMARVVSLAYIKGLIKV